MSSQDDLIEDELSFSLDDERQSHEFMIDDTRVAYNPNEVINEGLDDHEAKHPQPNKFFMGLGIAIPISIIIWCIIYFTFKWIF